MSRPLVQRINDLLVAHNATGVSAVEIMAVVAAHEPLIGEKAEIIASLEWTIERANQYILDGFPAMVVFNRGLLAKAQEHLAKLKAS